MKEENEPPTEGGEEKNPEAERARRTRIEIRKEERPRVLPAYDVVATGGVDDLVKVWQYEDGELRLRHKLGDHSLGVVSVALSKEAKYLGRTM